MQQFIKNDLVGRQNSYCCRRMATLMSTILDAIMKSNYSTRNCAILSFLIWTIFLPTFVPTTLETDKRNDFDCANVCSFQCRNQQRRKQSKAKWKIISNPAAIAVYFETRQATSIRRFVLDDYEMENMRIFCCTLHEKSSCCRIVVVCLSNRK